MRYLLILFLLAGAASAQELMKAGDALDKKLCEQMRDEVMPRIEKYTRMKFRRGVPMRIEPKGVWDNKIKAAGYAGSTAKHALAYYMPSRNYVTVVPWVIGGYAADKPRELTKQAWIEELEPTMIHELTHAIHHQNFHTEGRFYAASMRSKGLSEEELDRSTVDFLMGEGVPELVALRTTEFVGRMSRHPNDPTSAARLMARYRPDGKQAYRLKLMAHGYSDGLDLMSSISLKSGPRGIRAILSRPPPRVLLFQPEILATVELDDPPEPDSPFQVLSVGKLKGKETLRATFPGPGRYFRTATVRRRAAGCLIGYVATVGDATGPDGAARYAIFIADPDRASPWVGEQLDTLKAINPSGVTESRLEVPMQKGVKATVVNVKLDGTLYVYAEAGGLVVIAHETKPTKNLQERVLLALSYLYIRKPKAGLYTAATAVAQKKLSGG